MLSSLPKQESAAKKRLEARRDERHRNIQTIRQPGGILEADTAERVEKRLERLARYYRQEGDRKRRAGGRSGSRAETEAAIERLVRGSGPRVRAREALDAETAAVATLVEGDRQLERVINLPDFMDIRYLEAGVAASRAVGRVRIVSPAGRLEGYGTGFMVTPRLLLTNHHVLASKETAAASFIEFNYQDGLDGSPLDSTSFGLSPSTFWMTDDQLDFSLVAVEADEASLGEFGFNRLIEAEGKVIIGEAVTIVQHPGGERKQVAIRENRVVDLPELYLHYETDTKPGSSGSPVFNDQWEAVALHHASVRLPGHDELGGYANEGIRVSRLLQYIRTSRPGGNATQLRDRLFESDLASDPRRPGLLPPPYVAKPIRRGPDTGAQTSVQGARGADGSVTVQVPLEITVRLGGGATVAGVATRLRGQDNGAVAEEAVSIDPDYASRKGYDPRFLGTGRHQVALPKLSAELRGLASVNTQPSSSDPPHVLPYHHYSVIMNKERRLALLTAVNIDGHISHAIKRESDRWFFDPRIPRDEQTGNDVYADNPLDRGHLVRRLDPAWGTSLAVAKTANDDTFHFTNSTPQHHDFNANRTTWAGLEDYILKNADNHDLKVSVMTGPVLADDDDEYRGVQLPRQFWKVVAMVKDDGDLSATAYLLSQGELLQGLERVPEEFTYGEYKTFQVPVSRIEELTGLDFGRLKDSDPLDGRESTGREIPFLEDLEL